MRLRPVNLLKWVLGLGVAGYLGLLALLYVAQRHLLYPRPQTTRTSPASIGFPVEEVVLEAERWAS